MIERLLASRTNRLLALGLFAYLVVLPLAGVHVSTGAELVGGNFVGVVGYLAASIAAGASVVDLHEGRRHRRAEAEHRRLEVEHREAERLASARHERHLAQIRAHLAAARHLHHDPEKDTPA